MGGMAKPSVIHQPIVASRGSGEEQGGRGRERYSRGQAQHPTDDGGGPVAEAVVTHRPPGPAVETDLQPALVGVRAHQASPQPVGVTCQNKPHL